VQAVKIIVLKYSKLGFCRFIKIGEVARLIKLCIVDFFTGEN
jgi:hypothetical protein